MSRRLSGRGRGGVSFEDVVRGEGAVARRGARVEVRYTLSLNRGERVQEHVLCAFRVGARRVIPALEYGVEGMRVGGERRIRAAPHLGYGERGVPGLVPPSAVVEFHIILLAVDVEPDGGS